MNSPHETPDSKPLVLSRSAKRHSLARLGARLRSVVDWLRAGYPDEAPATGYSPLMALNGPIALTPKQRGHVLAELRGEPSDIVDIGVAITRATDRLPTVHQVRAVARTLYPSSPARIDPSQNSCNREGLACGHFIVGDDRGCHRVGF